MQARRLVLFYRPLDEEKTRWRLVLECQHRVELLTDQTILHLVAGRITFATCPKCPSPIEIEVEEQEGDLANV
jgi:hypothetical protein